MVIPTEYTVQKFYQYVAHAKHNKAGNTYQGSCPICREGKSFGKKKRCYFVVDKDLINCFNCGWSSKPFKWIQKVSGLTYDEIQDEIENYDILPVDVLKNEVYLPVKRGLVPRLPDDSINLFDQNQVNFYKDSKVVQDAIALIKQRRIDTAINRPDTIWLSLNDFTHKNRLTIPFYNAEGDIIFYQTREIYKSFDDKFPKYLSKINGDKSLFNINRISTDLDYIFIFEGPIDSFFVQNGTAVAGIQEKSSQTFTALQKEQISQFKFHEKIWALDNQYCDTASFLKTKKLIDLGERVFIWPEQFIGSYKDINELCIDQNKDSIDPQFFIENSYYGLQAKLKLSPIRPN